jgi:wyosine [tRNA(Phe)-imidazoG37] synthetase (radical SAM superfamily)
VVKLDAGTNWMLDQLHRPAEYLSINDLVWRISVMPEIIIQSMFVEGPVDNTRPEHVRQWIDKLRQLRPLSVQIYSLDRQPAESWVRPVRRQRLNEIASQVETALHIPVHVY